MPHRQIIVFNLYLNQEKNVVKKLAKRTKKVQFNKKKELYNRNKI